MLHSVSSIKKTLRFTKPDVASLTGTDLNELDALDFLISRYEEIMSTPETLVKVEAWAMQAGGVANKALAKLGGFFKRTIKPIELKDVASKSEDIIVLIKRVIQALLNSSFSDEVRLSCFIGVLVKKVKADSLLYNLIFKEVMNTKGLENLLVPEFLVKLVEASSPYTDKVWEIIVETKRAESFYLCQTDGGNIVANQQVMAAMFRPESIVSYLKSAESFLPEESSLMIFYMAAIEGFLISGSSVIDLVAEVNKSGNNLCELFFDMATSVDAFNSKAGSDQSGGGGKKEPATVWVDRLVLDLNFRKADIQLSESSIVLRAAAGMSDNERKTNILRGCDSKKHSKDQLLLEIMGKNLVHLPAYLDVYATSETGSLSDEICKEIGDLNSCKIIPEDPENKQYYTDGKFGREFNGDFSRSVHESVFSYFKISKKEVLLALLQQVDNMSDKKLSLAIMKSIFRILPSTIRGVIKCPLLSQDMRELTQTILDFMPAYLVVGDEALQNLKILMVADCFMPAAPIEIKPWIVDFAGFNVNTGTLVYLAVIADQKELFSVMMTILKLLGVERAINILNHQHFQQQLCQSERFHSDRVPSSYRDTHSVRIEGMVVYSHTAFTGAFCQQPRTFEELSAALQSVFSLDDQHVIFRLWAVALSYESKVRLAGTLKYPENKLLVAACTDYDAVSRFLSNMSSIQDVDERKSKFVRYFQATTPWGEGPLALMFLQSPNGKKIRYFLDWIQSEFGEEMLLELLMTFLESEYILYYSAAVNSAAVNSAAVNSAAVNANLINKWFPPLEARVIKLVFGRFFPVLKNLSASDLSVADSNGSPKMAILERFADVLRNPAYLKSDWLFATALDMILAHYEKPFPVGALQLIVEKGWDKLDWLLCDVERLGEASKVKVWNNILAGQDDATLKKPSHKCFRLFIDGYLVRDSHKIEPLYLLNKVSAISCAQVKVLLIAWFFQFIVAYFQEDITNFKHYSDRCKFIPLLNFFRAHIDVINTIDNRFEIIKGMAASFVATDFTAVLLMLGFLCDMEMPVEDQLVEVVKLFKHFDKMTDYGHIPDSERRRLAKHVARVMPPVVELWREQEPSSPYLKFFKRIPAKQEPASTPVPKLKIRLMASPKRTGTTAWIKASFAGVQRVLSKYLKSKTQGANNFKEEFCRKLVDDLEQLYKAVNAGEKTDLLFAQLGNYLSTKAGDDQRYVDMLASDKLLKQVVERITTGLRDFSKPFVKEQLLSKVTTVVYGSGGGGSRHDPEVAKTEDPLTTDTLVDGMPVVLGVLVGGGGSHDPEGPKMEEEFVTGVRL